MGNQSWGKLGRLSDESPIPTAMIGMIGQDPGNYYVCLTKNFEVADGLGFSKPIFKLLGKKKRKSRRVLERKLQQSRKPTASGT